MVRMLMRWLGGRESSLCFGKEFRVSPSSLEGFFCSSGACGDGYHFPASDTCTGLINVLYIAKYGCCSYGGWVSA